MFTRFAIGYLSIGLLVSGLLNLGGALHGTGTAFEWSSSLVGTLQHFTATFVVPMATWPTIVYQIALDMFAGSYTSWF